jgi:hypothetical protein
LLDSDIEELQKSLEADAPEEELEELEKSVGDDDADTDDESEGSEEDSEDDEDADDSDDEDNEDSEEEEEMEKSVGSDLRKSLADDHGQAFEVSDFLTALVDEMGFGMEGLQKSLTHMTKQQVAIVKSLTTVAQVVQDMAMKVEGLESENAELRKSLDTIAERPVGRKSVVNQREVQTLQKSIDTPANGAPLTRKAIGDILMKSFEAGELNGGEIARFEGGVGLDKLNLPPRLKNELGLK